MLRSANAALNLTRIHNFENMVLKHYVDSLLVLRFTELPSPLIDMGSGPGLPGIPLKLARPHVQMILSEPRGARTEFLRDVCERLKLAEIEVYPHRLGPNYPGQVNGVISRAVASIPETLEKVAACLVPGGKMLFMKGPDCDLEKAEAERTLSEHFRLEADHAYEIPGTTHRRRLVIYERLDSDPTVISMGRETALSPARAFSGRMRLLESPSNPTFRRCRELLTGAGIRKHGEAILAGSRVCAEILENFPDRVVGWITDLEGEAPPTPDLEWLRLSGAMFKELDVAGTHAPLLLVDVPPLPEWSPLEPWPEGCTLFVPFQDPENVGAVIRTAAAFGAARVVLLSGASHPFHPRASRAAGSGLFQVPLLTGPPVDRLDTGDVPLIALDTTGPELSKTPFPERFGLVVGVEGPGLPAHLRQGERRRIAMQPGVESLNAATAAAIALYAWSLERPDASGI